MAKEDVLPKIAKKIIEEATTETLGSTFRLVMSFHLNREFGRDAYSVLLEDPRSFYNELRNLLADGADTLLRLVNKHLAEHYGMKRCTSEEIEQFARQLTSGEDSAKRKIREVMAKAVDQKRFLSIV